MGLFDYLKIQKKLPTDALLKQFLGKDFDLSSLEYQTKDLENAMLTYEIRKNGDLYYEQIEYRESTPEEKAQDKEEADKNKFFAGIRYRDWETSGGVEPGVADRGFPGGGLFGGDDAEVFQNGVEIGSDPEGEKQGQSQSDPKTARIALQWGESEEEHAQKRPVGVADHAEREVNHVDVAAEVVEGDGEGAENDSPDTDGDTGPEDEFLLVHRLELLRGVEEGDEGLGKGGEDGVEAGDGGGKGGGED